MVKEREQDEELTAQVEFEGEPFTRLLDPNLSPSRQTRRVRIIGALDTQTGETVFVPASEVHIEPSQLPHVSLGKAGELHDTAEVSGSSLATVRSHGASTPGIDQNEIYVSRGGDPTFRRPKTGGFFSPRTPRELAAVRRRKRQGQGG